MLFWLLNISRLLVFGRFLGMRWVLCWLLIWFIGCGSLWVFFGLIGGRFGLRC